MYAGAATAAAAVVSNAMHEEEESRVKILKGVAYLARLAARQAGRQRGWGGSEAR